MASSEPFIGLYDERLWQGMREGRLDLQQCNACGAWRYPPGPVCAECLSPKAEWKPVSGRGTVISWVVFHRQYFDDFTPPYNSIAVRLAEGPIVVSNLVGPEPEGSWIGRPVELALREHEGRTQHAFRLAEARA